LPLGFDAEMCPGFCKGDFDLSTANEECDDVGGRMGGVGTEEGLRVALALGVSDKHPAVALPLNLRHGALSVEFCP
jgi:hypothetical protein